MLLKPKKADQSRTGRGEQQMGKRFKNVVRLRTSFMVVPRGKMEFFQAREGKRNEGRGEEKMAFKIVTPLDSRSNIHRLAVVPI